MLLALDTFSKETRLTRLLQGVELVLRWKMPIPCLTITGDLSSHTNFSYRACIAKRSSILAVTFCTVSVMMYTL